MKHLVAGALAALLVAGVMIVVAAIWTMFNAMLGPVAAIAGVILVVLVAIIATVIDWRTEKEEE